MPSLAEPDWDPDRRTGGDRGWGTPEERAIRRAGPDALGRLDFAGGSMGPKVQAACEFAAGTGRRAGIGALSAAGAILEGRAGTIVTTDVNGIELLGAGIDPPRTRPTPAPFGFDWRIELRRWIMVYH